MRAATKVLAAAVCLFAPRLAFSAEANGEPICVEVDIEAAGTKSKLSQKDVPSAARKMFSRYVALAGVQAPLVLARGGTDDRRFSWIVCKNEAVKTLVFLTFNAADESRRFTFKIAGKKPLTPTYRRVYSADGGKTWGKIAYEPPHSSITKYPQAMPEPYTLEVPAHSYQTATVRLK